MSFVNFELFGDSTSIGSVSFAIVGVNGGALINYEYLKNGFLSVNYAFAGDFTVVLLPLPPTCYFRVDAWALVVFTADNIGLYARVSSTSGLARLELCDTE